MEVTNCKSRECVRNRDVSGFELLPNDYHSFGYYVLGGIDVSGEALRLDGHAEFDDEAEISGSRVVDGTTDPRVSKFDIVEQTGAAAYEKVQQIAEGKGLPTSNEVEVSQSE